MSSLQTASARSRRPQNVRARQDTDEALAERRRISFDIHDSAIQPYIGLKLALEALARKVAPGHPLSGDIGRLVEMAEVEIESLRRYVMKLRDQCEPDAESLESALRRQSAHFAELYGIEVAVVVNGESAVEPWLADELLYLTREGLSNIRRHTRASCALINLSCGAQKIVLTIANLCDGRNVKPFTPASIAERAQLLGGTVRVETGAGRNTVVVVEIPLPA